MKTILLFNEDPDFCKEYFIDMVYKMWLKRNNILKSSN